jgi:hypothetical protein
MYDFGVFFRQSGSVASHAVYVNEVIEDARALSRVWDLYGELLKKHRLVHSSVEIESSFNSI